MTKLKFFISPNFSIPSIWHFLSHTFMFSKPILKAFASAINLCKTCCLFLYKNSLFLFLFYTNHFLKTYASNYLLQTLFYFLFFLIIISLSLEITLTSHFSLIPDQTRPILSPLSPPKPPSQPPLPLFAAAAAAASSSTRHKRRRRSSLIARNYDVLSSVLFVFVRFEKQQQALIIRKLQGKPHFAPFLTSLHLLLSDSKLYCHVI